MSKFITKILFIFIILIYPLYSQSINKKYYDEIIKVKDIKPGMIGYGLSVFRGSKIEKFRVEVIDILKNVLPDEDLILVKCSSVYNGYNIEKSGVIAGMSGSPVYFNGKLAGAISYTWSFLKEPIAGVTPIENMFKILERPLEKKIANVDNNIFNLNNDNNNLSYNNRKLIPIKIPLSISGVSTYSLNKIKKYFNKYNIEFIQSGNISIKNIQKNNIKLEPGSAIGVQLVGGDINLSAIGTVTWVKDNKVLAFGHPFFSLGEISFPITTAWISSVISRTHLSFKLGSPINVVGTLLQDRDAGIFGYIGKKSKTIPVKIKIRNKILNIEKIYNYRIVNHQFFTPLLLSIITYTSIDNFEPTLGDYFLNYSLKVYFNKNKSPLKWKNIEVGNGMIIGGFLRPIKYLFSNPYKKVSIDKIILNISISHKIKYANIDKVIMEPEIAKPGDKIKINLRLTPLFEFPKYKTIEIKLPKSIPPGKYKLNILSGRLMKEPVITPYDFKTYLQYIMSLNKYKNNEIVIVITTNDYKVCLKSKKFKNIPISILNNLIKTSHLNDIQILSNPLIYPFKTDYYIDTKLEIPFVIEED